MSVSLFPPGCMQDVVEGLAQARLADGLAQERSGAGGAPPLLLLLAGPARDEEDRNTRAALGQEALDLEPVHVRHAHVEQQAVGLRRQLGAQELRTGSEALCAVAEGADEPAGRLPHRRVVVADRGDRLPRPLDLLDALR